jgi:tRNA pseudouridine55 synthase
VRAKKTRIKVAKRPTLKEVRKIVYNFKGEIIQKPPIYSAVKIKGKEAYKLARRGRIPELAPRKIKIIDNKVSELSNTTGRIYG